MNNAAYNHYAVIIERFNLSKISSKFILAEIESDLMINYQQYVVYLSYAANY